jgi:hypothetical protein
MGTQKPGFYDNFWLQRQIRATHSTSLSAWLGGEAPETGFFTTILDCSREIS